MSIVDTQLPTLLAILAMVWFISTLSRLLVPISLVLGVSLLSAFSNVTAQRVLAAVFNYCGFRSPLIVVALARWVDALVIKVATLVVNFDLAAIHSILRCWFSPQRDTGSDVAQPLERDALPLTAEDETPVSSPCMPLARHLGKRTPDLTVQLDAANEAIASITSRMAVLAEQKDDALTRANTLENGKESWAVRERALVSTIKNLKTSSSNKPLNDVAGLRARLQDAESMLEHQISVRTKLEDEVVRYREMASSNFEELRILRKETTKRIHDQAVEIAKLKGQVLAMQERERQLTPPPEEAQGALVLEEEAGRQGRLGHLLELGVEHSFQLLPMPVVGPICPRL